MQTAYGKLQKKSSFLIGRATKKGGGAKRVCHSKKKIFF